MTTNTNVDIQFSKGRLRTASLKLQPNGRFLLVAPESTPQHWIDLFLKKRQKWMQKVLLKKKELSSWRKIVPHSYIKTPYYTIFIEEDTTLKYPHYQLKKNNAERHTTFFLPSELFGNLHQEALYKNLEKYLLAELLRLESNRLLQRAEYWARRHKIQVAEFFVRAQKSRLGYCTHSDRIMLNIRLLFTSAKYIDYVICHELAHTKHRNHSKDFWEYLETLYPNAKKIDRELNNPHLYAMPRAKKISATTKTLNNPRKAS
ncbi:MAG: hypothetical protein LDLANPLL_00524 [Turneriella sp.]|nr:hypothetical protein [Turneriella sp.]